ncbi:MAG TPA: tail fiber domain-containing protein [Thermoanaerobaculia bacterium]|nr:tail fiber domain-containing protein [Thermoanaerobaculia bacterium]
MSGPEGSVERMEFPSGRAIAITTTLPNGKTRPDGVYTYELRAQRSVVPAAPAVLSGNETADGRPVETDAATKARPAVPPPPLSGSFWIQNGSFVAGSALEPPQRRGAPSTPGNASGAGRAANAGRTALDFFVNDDQIVVGSGCFGFDCVNNEVFGLENLLLKQNNNRIRFDDTSVSAGFPNNDWQIRANDDNSGGLNRFSIEDLTAARIPFTILAGAPANSIFVDASGRLGVRTGTPAQTIHAAGGDTPGLRLEQNGSSGFTPQTWDVAGNESNFFVRDVTGGNTLPFRIHPGAPSSSIDIATNGNVGIGTGAAAQKLTVMNGPIFVAATAANLDVFAGMGIDLGSGPAFNYGYAGSSFGRSAGFFNVRPDASAVAPNPSLRFMTANVQRMIITNTGNVGIGVANPSQPLQMASGAFVSAGGVWTNASSRSLKDDIRDLPADEALETLQGLSPVTYVYKAAPSEPHVGFIAEDVPALLASPDRKGMSPMDVAAVLTKVVQQQQKTIEELKARLDELEKKK